MNRINKKSKGKVKLKLKKANVKDSKFNKKALKEGALVEKEHTNNQAVAKAIAKAHLSEDNEYYRKLKKYIEKRR